MGRLFDSPTLVVVLLVAVIVIFGSKRLPDAARGVGRSLRIFKAETKGLMTDDEQAGQQQVPPVVQPQPVAPVVSPVQPPVNVPVQPQPGPPVQQSVPPAAPVTPEADQPQA